jgi:hypothetical protein
MLKTDLEDLIQHIFDIAENRNDPYAKDDEKLAQIRDLCAQVVGQPEWCPGRYSLPKQKKKRKAVDKFGVPLSAYHSGNTRKI